MTKLKNLVGNEEVVWPEFRQWRKLRLCRSLEAGSISALAYVTLELMTIGSLMMAPMLPPLSAVSQNSSRRKKDLIEGADEQATNSGDTVVSFCMGATGIVRCNQWTAQSRWTGHVKGLWQTHPLVSLLSRVI
jgi:hypothetical protein